MSESHALGDAVTTMALHLTKGDVHAAAAATGVASARLLGLLSKGHPDVNFETALKKSLEMYEKVARHSRSAEL